MRIQSVRLHHFRNYTDETIAFPDAIVLFYGKNGQGKTNLLESLYVGSIGKSYRGVSDSDVIQWDQQDGSVIIDFIRSGVPQQVKIILSKVKKKELWVNETKVSQRELMGTLHEVLFAPEDLQLIKGSPSLRRRFMDMEISQVSPTYYKELLQYNRAVAQRNLLLKQGRYTGIQSLGEWDTQIARLAASLVRKRLASLHKMSVLAGVIHKRLSAAQEQLTMSYVQPYFRDGVDTLDDVVRPQWYYDLLQEHFEEDTYRASTSIGPHRDDLAFYIDGIDVKRYGSQGQQRTAVLALKLSELEYMKSESGEYPVLLLDDVMSELDADRRQALLQFVKGRIQTFITTTEPLLFAAKDGCAYIEITKGQVDDHGKTEP